MGQGTKIRKSELRQAIREEGGNINRVARRFDVSRQTIYNNVDKYGLRGEVGRWRQMVFDMAEDNLLGAVEEGDVDVSKFVVTHFPGAMRWSSKHEVNVGAVHLSDDVLSMLEALGLSIDSVSAEFEAMIRQYHAETVGDGGKQ